MKKRSFSKILGLFAELYFLSFENRHHNCRIFAVLQNNDPKTRCHLLFTYCLRKTLIFAWYPNWLTQHHAFRQYFVCKTTISASISSVLLLIMLIALCFVCSRVRLAVALINESSRCVLESKFEMGCPNKPKYRSHCLDALIHYISESKELIEAWLG